MSSNSFGLHEPIELDIRQGATLRSHGLGVQEPIELKTTNQWETYEFEYES